MFSPTSVVVWKPVGGGKLWSVTLMLHRAASGAKAEVTGGTREEACAKAEAEACKASGGAEGCVAKGTHERVEPGAAPVKAPPMPTGLLTPVQ